MDSNNKKAMEYFKQARECYEEWGSSIVVAEKQIEGKQYYTASKDVQIKVRKGGACITGMGQSRKVQLRRMFKFMFKSH
eukprot:scaffold33242_cov72-Skeletonema_dohrnii-CCMP3373.AAC.1